MEIIQTLNSGKDQNTLIDEISILLRNNINKIRFNLCKYKKDDLPIVIESIKTVLDQYNNELELFFDIPYPRNKSRIIDYSIEDGLVKAESFYTIVSNRNNDAELGDNIIHLGISSFEFLDIHKGQIVYFGDGEGSFIVERKTDNKIIVKAINSFRIFENKAITVGFIQEENPYYYVDTVLECFGANVTFFLSFCSEEKELKPLKDRYEKKCKFIPKIELISTKLSLEQLLTSADGAMLARGDLFLLNDIKSACEYYDYVGEKMRVEKKELYIATDIMKSLKEREFPSRSDIVDLFYAKKMCATHIVLPYRISPRLQLILNIIKELTD